ncbi:unnamed protein product [Acanthosepion pharaonis]|uniref:Uncharacterized protein n=1 Tax=Acanthosepion pharaonis TaxID=158019 RepID=A0A812AX41_ACAPH|nr:unnamed protein product [Sepia pharaonis]
MINHSSFFYTLYESDDSSFTPSVDQLHYSTLSMNQLQTFTSSTLRCVIFFLLRCVTDSFSRPAALTLYSLMNRLFTLSYTLSQILHSLLHSHDQLLDSSLSLSMNTLALSYTLISTDSSLSPTLSMIQQTLPLSLHSLSSDSSLSPLSLISTDSSLSPTLSMITRLFTISYTLCDQHRLFTISYLSMIESDSCILLPLYDQHRLFTLITLLLTDSLPLLHSQMIIYSFCRPLHSPTLSMISTDSFLPTSMNQMTLFSPTLYDQLHYLYPLYDQHRLFTLILHSL